MPIRQNNLNVGCIGNCAYCGLVDDVGRVVWMCLPRFDSNPVFCDLINGAPEPQDDANKAGFWDFLLVDFSHAVQEYVHNTAILSTKLHDNNGGCVQILDFAPRFERRGRMFRPIQFIRRVIPVSGDPRLIVRLRPMANFGEKPCDVDRGSNHVRYNAGNICLRLTTDAPISYVLEERPFLLERELCFVLGPDETLEQAPKEIAREFYEATEYHWRQFVRGLSVPFEYQQAVIRAAITLKLCNWEESGAIIAAMTTSIPEHYEAAGALSRNWSYLYVWVRDSLFTVSALNQLGATDTLESYLSFIMNLIASSPDGYIQPLFGLTLEKELTEQVVPTLSGYRGQQPVRVGNGAYIQKQNDGYGSIVLAVTQLFFDERLSISEDMLMRYFRRLEKLGEQAVKRYKEFDAGLWELRTIARVHTYSSVMCWAACDRLGWIAKRLKLGDRADYWSEQAKTIHQWVWENCYNKSLQSFVDAAGGDQVDACLLLLPELHFLEWTHPRFLSTLQQVEKQLRRGFHMYRYIQKDDFGVPKTAFNICSFWLIGALAGVGRVEEARELFDKILACRNHAGLLSEDMDFDTHEQWGNQPQAYSMTAIINCARKLSKSWNDAF